MAWETRNVKISALNDSKYIGEVFEYLLRILFCYKIKKNMSKSKVKGVLDDCPFLSISFFYGNEVPLPSVIPNNFLFLWSWSTFFSERLSFYAFFLS